MELDIVVYQSAFVFIAMITLCNCAAYASTISSLRESKCDSGKMYDQLSESCCRVCGPGYGVALPCVATNDTICERCVDGEKYSATTSYEDFCEPCSLCPSNSDVLHKCNSTHNTKCQCKIGYYYYAEQKMCKLCDRCSPGQKAEPPCSPFQNTVCKSCPPNHYSSETSSTSVCKVCSACTNGKRVKVECSLTHDTVCEDGNNSNGDNNEIAVEDSGHNLIPVYCAPFVAIFFSLIGYVIVKRWKLCCDPPSKSTGSINKSPLDQGITNNNNKRSLPKELKPMLSPAGENILVSNLHKETLATVERLLTDCNVDVDGWKALARCSGFNESRIKRLDSEASRCKMPGAKLFFRDWMRSACPTVNQLYENLIKIHRDDCNHLIRLTLTCKSNETVVPMQFI